MGTAGDEWAFLNQVYMHLQLAAVCLISMEAHMIHMKGHSVGYSNQHNSCVSSHAELAKTRVVCRLRFIFTKFDRHHHLMAVILMKQPKNWVFQQMRQSWRGLTHDSKQKLSGFFFRTGRTSTQVTSTHGVGTK